MGSIPSYATLPNFPLGSSDRIVAPFAANIDTSSPSTYSVVKYADLTLDVSQKQRVHHFIRGVTKNEYFYGDSMIVAEWYIVPEHNSGDTVRWL